MNTFSNSGLIPSTLQGTRETDDFGTDTFDSGIGTDLDPVAYKQKIRWYHIIRAQSKLECSKSENRNSMGRVILTFQIQYKFR